MDWKEARLEVITGPVSVTWARERPEPQQHCCEKSLQPWWLKPTLIYYLTVLGV